MLCSQSTKGLNSVRRNVKSDLQYRTDACMGNPDDLAGVAVFLASADSDYVVAQTLNVDGGNWMS